MIFFCSPTGQRDRLKAHRATVSTPIERRFRRNLVVPASSREGPLTIRFADLRGLGAAPRKHFTGPGASRSHRGTKRFYGAGGEDVATSSLQSNRWSAAMPQPNDLSRSLVALDHNSTIIAVVELSQSSWLVGGVLPGIERQPRKKLEPSPERLLAVLHRWRDEAVRAGRNITRIALAFEAGRDGFWLARWLAARGVEAHV